MKFEVAVVASLEFTISTTSKTLLNYGMCLSPNAAQRERVGKSYFGLRSCGLPEVQFSQKYIKK